MNCQSGSPWCPTPLCALAWTRVPHNAAGGCALAFAVAIRAGQEIAADAAAVCAECGTTRAEVPRETWRRSWNGEPLCAECRVVLELDGELAGFDTLVAELPDSQFRPAEEFR